MQRPTLQNVRIRSTRDALQVFTAVARRKLPLITRRLDAEERRAIAPGNIYVWEERGANNETSGLGMERWTDGMGWGPSRVRDEFLFYHQKEIELGEETHNPLTPWSQMISVYPASHSRPSNETERLIKQTYSVFVSLPSDEARGLVRKWHLTAYFSQQKLDSLNTIDSLPGIGDVPTPDGWFRSARASKLRREHRDSTAQSRDPKESDTTSAAASNLEFLSHTQSSSSSSRLPYASCGQYRDQSRVDLLSISPPPSDHSHSSSPSSSPSTRPSTLSLSGQLVPLQFLENVSYPRREPTDEQLLRRLSTHSLSPSSPSANRPLPRDPV